MKAFSIFLGLLAISMFEILMYTLTLNYPLASIAWIGMHILGFAILVNAIVGIFARRSEELKKGE